jgi:glycosyltransferase involved in cell wall biosynthesis
MRVGVTTVSSPFIKGGAEFHASGLVGALREAGHETELISMPFRFNPVSEVRRSMDVWSSENLEELNGYQMDRVICLKFPSYYLRHGNKVVWLLHQHRSVYELWDSPYSEELRNSEEGRQLRSQIIARDNAALSEARAIFANSRRVSERLQQFNQLSAKPLYHPPSLADHFYSADPEPYIFAPSRLEGLKRQQLLIEAMRYTRSPVVALIAGEGGTRAELETLVERFGLQDRVRFLGRLTDDEMTAFYAHSLAVFFGPYDEDYGYVTLEAMLSGKPVITCTDSGGPLEFVVDDETGLICEPDPAEIAGAISRLVHNRRLACAMGQAGLERYRRLGITWEHAVETLVGPYSDSALTSSSTTHSC